MLNRQALIEITMLLTLLSATLIAWFVVPINASILRVPQDYPTIQDAVNAAGAGDTIQVDAGTFSENVIVTTGVTIIGASSTTTFVDGGSNDIVFDIQADNVELRDLTIRNGGSYSGVIIYYPYDGLVIRNTRIVENAVGVVISEADGNTIEDSVFISNSMYGIDVMTSTSNIIRNNQISESAYGVEISETSDSQVVNNTVSDTSYGIYVPYSSDNNISANTLNSNSWHIYLTHSDSNTVGYNTISGGTVGIQVMYSQGNSVFNNTVSNGSYGLYLGYCDANTVSGNTVSLTDWGIEIYNSSGSTIEENLIWSNAWGFYLASNSKWNYIYHNNVLDNVKQVFQDLTSGQNTWRTPTTPYQGNYWSNYIGEDTTGDGVGDTYLPWEGVDWYPLMEPWMVTHDVAVIGVTPSANQVYKGEMVVITVVTENQGTWIETYNVTVTYENATLGIFGTIGIQEVTNLAPSTQKTLIFTWDTSNVQVDTIYLIVAEADAVPGEVDTNDNVLSGGFVEVKKSPAACSPGAGGTVPLFKIPESP